MEGGGFQMGGGAGESPVDEPVRLVSYDPRWPELFDREKALLEAAIGQWITGGPHHVGSTAVPGLDAKPVIDILVGVRGLDASRACFAALAQLGYAYAPYRAGEMHWFCKPGPRRRTHHLHVVPTGFERYSDELAFRDVLRNRADVAAQYVELKRRLAAVHAHDREAYTQGKAVFIRWALTLAGRPS
jgi:GrpB-like predicted nucleotidyltransferase (UPF0157 family)